MGAAFDNVCKLISTEMSDNDDVRRTLALIILRLVDRGEECNSPHLAEIAFQEWTGTHRSAIGQPGNSQPHHLLIKLTLIWRTHTAWLISQKHSH
jgi:hypothetical protein